MADRDPTEFFYGSDTGIAGRGAVGLQLSPRNAVRFEVDVPTWRKTDTVTDAPLYCGEAANCVGGPGFVPAHTTSHASVRSVSIGVLYARNIQVGNKVHLALLAGGGSEARAFQSSGSVDERGPDGRVVRHTEYNTSNTKMWFAALLGADLDVQVSAHLAVVPQVRFHTFPYPAVSIVRPGVALRWRFS